MGPDTVPYTSDNAIKMDFKNGPTIVSDFQGISGSWVGLPSSPPIPTSDAGKGGRDMTAGLFNQRNGPEGRGLGPGRDRYCVKRARTEYQW